MGQSLKTPNTFEHLDNDLNNKRMGDEALFVIDEAEEFEWLMSLALDDELSTDERARLDFLLSESSENVELWRTWQEVDSTFLMSPAVAPPVDFCEKFALCLEVAERQRRLRTGVIFGVAAVALWGSVLLGLVGLGALLWSDQGAIFSNLVENVAYWWTGIQQLGRALANTLQLLWSAPQTRMLFGVYVFTAIAILSGWFVFLRRSTRELPLSGSPLSSSPLAKA